MERATRSRVRRRREEPDAADRRLEGQDVRKLASALGNQAFARLAQARLQRKLGLEIETALPASRAVAGEDEQMAAREPRQQLRHQLLADVRGTSGDRTRVRPKERMYDGPGWYATADNTDRLGDGSRVNVELVTDPPLATGRDEAAELKATVDHVKTMQEWAQKFAATGGTARTLVGDYAVGFPSEPQVRRLGREDPLPQFAPRLGAFGVTTQWNSGACTLTLTSGGDTIVISDGDKGLAVRGTRKVKTKTTTLNIAKCIHALGTDYDVAKSWIRNAVSEVARPPERPAMPEYDRSLPNTEGFVQVNVGVSLAHAAALPKVEELRNTVRTNETTAQQAAPHIAARLKAVLTAVPEADLVGLATLLGSAVLGGRGYTPSSRELVKNMWSTLVKSELHSWWKLHLQAGAHDTGDEYVKKVPQLVAAFTDVLNVPAGDRLMLNYPSKDFVDVPQALAALAELKVGEYLTEVLSFSGDKLTAGILAHRATTAGDSSVIAAHGAGGDTGQDGAPPVGVLELRNIRTFWPGGKWAEEDRLRPYVHLAFAGARRPT
jgi:hypothetical protein